MVINMRIHTLIDNQANKCQIRRERYTFKTDAEDVKTTEIEFIPQIPTLSFACEAQQSHDDNGSQRTLFLRDGVSSERFQMFTVLSKPHDTSAERNKSIVKFQMWSDSAQSDSNKTKSKKQKNESSEK